MKIIAAYESTTVKAAAMKIMVWPDSVMIHSGKPLFLREDEESMLHFGIGARIDAVGKSIKPKFAARYFKEIAPLAFVLAPGVSDCLMEKQNPQACDITADYSIICGDFVEAASFPQPLSMKVTLEGLGTIKNKDIKHEEITFSLTEESGPTVLERLYESIAVASIRNTLKTGDLVCTLFPGRLKTDYDTLLKIYFDKEIPLLVNKLK